MKGKSKSKIFILILVVVFFLIFIGVDKLNTQLENNESQNSQSQQRESGDKRQGNKTSARSNNQTKQEIHQSNGNSPNSQPQLTRNQNNLSYQNRLCQNHFYNNQLPQVSNGYNNQDLTKLCYNSFALLHKKDFNISLFSAEKLTLEKELAARNGDRETSFYQDPILLKKWGYSIKHSDYTGSGYDRGHLAASRNQPNGKDRYESFYTSNIVPQTPENNRNIWQKIESQVRCFVNYYKTDIYVVTVPIVFNLPSNKLDTLNTKDGRKIVIPKYMAKAIYIPQYNYSLVYLTQNNQDKQGYKNISLKQLQEMSFIDVFPFLSQQVKEKVNLAPNPFQKGCKLNFN